MYYEGVTQLLGMVNGIQEVVGSIPIRSIRLKRAGMLEVIRSFAVVTAVAFVILGSRT